jgi:hypothetical protein
MSLLRLLTYILTITRRSGNDLLSQAVSHQVPSALKGLTSVFGMGTGVSLSLLSPDMLRLSFLTAGINCIGWSIHYIPQRLHNAFWKLDVLMLEVGFLAWHSLSHTCILTQNYTMHFGSWMFDVGSWI